MNKIDFINKFLVARRGGSCEADATKAKYHMRGAYDKQG